MDLDGVLVGVSPRSDLLATVADVACGVDGGAFCARMQASAALIDSLDHACSGRTKQRTLLACDFDIVERATTDFYIHAVFVVLETTFTAYTGTTARKHG